MDITMRQDFGARVRMMRKECGMSLRSFALMIGISKDYLVDIEYGRKSPTLDTLAKIAGGFDLSLSELLEGIGPMPTNVSVKPASSEPRYHLSTF